MTTLITGGSGFLGWHLRCHLRALHNTETELIARQDFQRLDEVLGRCDEEITLYHLAGVNRAATDEAVERGNIELAEALGDALKRSGRTVHLVYANSTQSRLDNAYGRGKARAAQILGEATAPAGGTLADVVLPNIFGEHGRPHYNSFVSTFCHLVASDEMPSVTGDREIPLLHAQRASAALVAAARRRESHVVEPDAEARLISGVLAKLNQFHDLYRTGEIPDLSDEFSVDLFNTYRSYTFPARLPIRPEVHTDPRGRLFETVRMHGGTGQSYASTTSPGQVRGEHYHLRKFERFVVVAGEAEIKLRRLFSDEVITFRVSGDDPGLVDMPTMWVHNIRNVGSSDLVTVFWSDQLLDRQNPDQFPEKVEDASS